MATLVWKHDTRCTKYFNLLSNLHHFLFSLIFIFLPYTKYNRQCHTFQVHLQWHLFDISNLRSEWNFNLYTFVKWQQQFRSLNKFLCKNTLIYTYIYVHLCLGKTLKFEKETQNSKGELYLVVGEYSPFFILIYFIIIFYTLTLSVLTWAYKNKSIVCATKAKVKSRLNQFNAVVSSIEFFLLVCLPFLYKFYCENFFPPLSFYSSPFLYSKSILLVSTLKG